MSKELYRSEDESGCIIVTEQSGKRILSFGSDLQQSSLYMHKAWHLVHEYTQIMLLGLIFIEAKNITLLGLGGGGLVHCLNHFYPACNLKVIEIRQLVIDVAYEWFALPRENSLQVICDEAGSYLSNAEQCSTDLLFSDLYEARGMSKVQQQGEFISNCNRALTDSGWLVINFHSLPDNDSLVMQQIQQLFQTVYICDVFKGNWVLFCGKAELECDKKELKKRVSELGKKIEMPLMYYFKQLRDYK